VTWSLRAAQPDVIHSYRNATPSGVLNLFLAARIPIVARLAGVHRGVTFASVAMFLCSPNAALARRR